MKYEKADKYITCIVCPNGCEVEVKQNGDSISVSGNKCKRGEVYVVQELTDPRRTISTTVPISNGELPLCSVRLTKPIPKKEIFRVIQEIRRIHLTAPVKIGQVVIEDVCGLGSDVIVTKEIG